MNGRTSKKIRQMYQREFRCKSSDVYKYFISIKPFYIPKKLWIYWLNK